MSLVLVRVHGAAEAHDCVVVLRPPLGPLASVQPDVGNGGAEAGQDPPEERGTAAVAVHERHDLHPANVYSRSP
jgi:hypothetical protein